MPTRPLKLGWREGRGATGAGAVNIGRAGGRAEGERKWKGGKTEQHDRVAWSAPLHRRTPEVGQPSLRKGALHARQHRGNARRAKLAVVVRDLVLALTGREGLVQNEGLPLDLERETRALGNSHRLLEATLADPAPGSDGVRDDVDHHCARRHCSWGRLRLGRPTGLLSRAAKRRGKSGEDVPEIKWPKKRKTRNPSKTRRGSP